MAGAVLLVLTIALIAACGGGDDEPPPTAQPTATPRLASTGSDTPAQRDLVDLAARLEGRPSLPRQVSLPAPSIGDEQDFWLLTLGDLPGRRTVHAVLRAISDHAYFYVESGSDIPDAEVQEAANVFEDSVWPEVTETFGLPEIPGVDGDPRIAILHADLAGAGGYVSGEDAYPRAVLPFSNERELVYVDTGVRPLGSIGYAGLVAHELQHLAQRRADQDEESWINEGLSEVARQLVSGVRPSFGTYLDAPDAQLNDWDVSGQNGAHYNASELFLTYLFEQTDGTPGDLARDPANGIEGVRAYLQKAGEPRSFEDLVADWAVANLLDRPDGSYGYRALDVSAPAIESVTGPGRFDGGVHQFGADYLELTAAAFPSGASISFQVEAAVPFFAGQNDADGAVWWSGRGDSIDSMLTRELDLTGVSTASLTYRTWFDIEEGFDYGYVEASSDGGATWQALPGGHTTEEDPFELAYGPGYTGRSGGGETASWVDERIDLSAYAGSKVLLRFEMVNDDAANRPGWAIDDVALPEIGFLDDAESDPGGWHRQGFRRLSEPLAQDYELRVVIMGDVPRVVPVQLDGANRATVDLAGLGSDYMRAILVIMGSTEGTTEPAPYTYDVAAPIR